MPLIFLVAVVPGWLQIVAARTGGSGEFFNGLLKENVTYKTGEGFAVLVRLVDHNSGWQGEKVFVDESAYRFLAKSALVTGDVVVANVGANAGSVFRVPQLDRPATLGPNAVLVRPKKDLLGSISKDFLYYYLASPLGQAKLQSLITGSAQPKFNKTALRGVQVDFPLMPVQQSISRLMLAFDDRITLLRETNATLEAIAQALFKSWFVDFDPVRAKMAGRAPDGMDEATAELFPDALEETELGVVPKGWQPASIYEVAKVIYGAPFASKQFKSEPPGMPLVRIRDLKDERPGVYTEECHPKGYMLQPGDIAVGMDGEFRAYLWGGDPAWLNQRVCVFQPIGDACSVFVRLSVAPLLAEVEASETATTVIHLGKNDIDRFRVLLPDAAVLRRFGELAESLYQRVVSNKRQAQSLSALRDALLPRLISGQLRLPEVQDDIRTVIV